MAVVTAEVELDSAAVKEGGRRRRREACVEAHGFVQIRSRSTSGTRTRQWVQSKPGKHCAHEIA